MVFSPHPDDETLACGGVILKAIRNNKKVKVVFLTNGEAYREACAAWYKKKPEAITSEEFIAFGNERQEEALEATKKLGLKEDDLFFLSYPDKGLSSLWEENYDASAFRFQDSVYSFYKSQATKRFSSPYKRTYNRAKKGYRRENIVLDIEDILKKHTPKIIYTPYPLDTNNDHQATTYLVNYALAQLKNGSNNWVGSLGISYFLIHSVSSDYSPWPNKNLSIVKDPAIFSQKPSRNENITDFKKQKEEALKVYWSKLKSEKEKEFLGRFVKDNELFWDMPAQESEYLNQLEEEWESAAKMMRQQGFNVNFAPVVDVAANIEDRNIYLVKRERIYSQYPDIVTRVTSAITKGMVKGGITPVIKHFPGLGSVSSNTHTQLPTQEISEKNLYRREIVPFKDLIKKENSIWVMVDHVMYPSLSKNPASLSYEIQTEILRKKLGFKNIIITDELLNMQSILEFVKQEKIKEPYIGEIVSRAFRAGADIALIYADSEKLEEIISLVISGVKQALKEGTLREETIDSSVERILLEKERIFGRPLQHLLKEMSLDEKITQKLIVDVYKDTGVSCKYILGGIRPRFAGLIDKENDKAKIPMFVVAEHEGGKVNEYLLKCNTRSAYMVGREFERLLSKKPEGGSRSHFVKDFSLSNSPNISAANFTRLDKDTRTKIISSLIDSVNRMMRSYYELKEKGYESPPQSNYLSPLTVSSDGIFEIKPFKDTPAVWLRSFPDQSTALSAYGLFKKIFEDWQENHVQGAKRVDEIILQLGSLKKRIEELTKVGNMSSVRVLCLAAHPDDEDGEALAYFAKKFNCETDILLATRGEGGENGISSVLYKELGFLRTEEIEKAASLLGVRRVYYLGKNDFGYCADAGKAFKNWDKADTLEKLVYFFRLIKPHIIITRHSESVHEHGQHQAFVILAKEAFDLAGNSESYPEMAKEGLSPWQPIKFYQRAQKMDSVSDNDSMLDPQEYVPEGNKTYYQLAREALREHHSQGDDAWGEKMDTPGKIFYQLSKSKVASLQENSFFEGIPIENSLVDTHKGKKTVSPSGVPGVKIVDTLRIGLVEKNSNILFVALKTLGYDCKKLNEESIKNDSLSDLDTIIIDQGVYVFFLEPPEVNKRLFEFVKKGGNVIVFSQYDKGHPVFSYALYPFNLCFNHVSVEDSSITILAPEQPLFNFPNKISSHDFDGWIQERGYAFPCEYSDKYTELLSCSFNGGLINGGYLISYYGKGSYIYTGFAWYRQFREFHVGAYKNLSNMVAHLYAQSNQQEHKKTNARQLTHISHK